MRKNIENDTDSEKQIMSIKTEAAVSMAVSGYVGEGSEKHFCVMFSRGSESVEIKIPSYKIIRKNGFTPEEVRDLVSYVRENEERIKAQAEKINVLSAFMKN